MGGGGFISKSFYSHDLFVQNNTDRENFGNLFFLGFSQHLKDSWYISSELGFQNSNVFVAIAFDQQFIGQDVERKTLLTWINNKRAYFGVLGEYRILKGNFRGYFKGGILMSSDLSNTRTTTNEKIPSDSNPFAVKLSTGIAREFNRFSIKASLDFVNYTPSRLISDLTPKIYFRQYHYNLSMMYKI